MKKQPQKLLIFGPNFFFSNANLPKSSPNLNSCSIKISHNGLLYYHFAYHAHQSPTPLEMQKEVIRGDFCRRSAKKNAAEGDIKVFSAYYLLSICFKERNSKKKKCSCTYTSHSAYVATDTESNGAKIDGF